MLYKLLESQIFTFIYCKLLKFFSDSEDGVR